MDSKYPDLHEIQIDHSYTAFVDAECHKRLIQCNFELNEGINTFISAGPSVSVRFCSIIMVHPSNRRLDKYLLQFDYCAKMTKALKKKSYANIITIHVENKQISNKHGPAIVVKNAEDETTTEVYCLDGYLHREDGPALKTRDLIIYSQNGLIHNDNGPAYIDDKAELYFKDGLLHRDNKPAIQFKNDSFLYLHHGIYHRPCKEGPAVFINREHIILECFLENNLYHNTEGPAYIYTGPNYTRKLWLINGLLHNTDGPADISTCHRSDRTTEIYLQYGFLHRINGPAVITSNTQLYYYRGLLHRISGPAVITPSYSKYYFYGHLHRDDGPAIVSPTMLRWCIMGNPNYNHGYSVVRIHKYRSDFRNRYCLMVCDSEDPHRLGDKLCEYNTKQEAMNKLAELQDKNTLNHLATPKLYNCKLWTEGEKNT
jgi:hypothetical protein